MGCDEEGGYVRDGASCGGMAYDEGGYDCCVLGGGDGEREGEGGEVYLEICVLVTAGCDDGGGAW